MGMKGGTPVWQEQYAATIADVLGLNYAAPHPVAKPIVLAR